MLTDVVLDATDDYSTITLEADKYSLKRSLPE